jgi:hypothetical protein
MYRKPFGVLSKKIVIEIARKAAQPVKTLYVIPGLECGQSHAYEVDIDIHALVLTGQQFAN